MSLPEELLREMLETPSLSGQEEAMAKLLVHRMEELGFAARRDEVGNALGVMGDGSVEIVLLGHMDTAPGEIPVHQEGDLLFGRGAVDAKGPLAAFICAVAQVGPQPGKRFIVIGAVEEECPTSRGAHHVATHYQPTAAIIGEPSDWDRVTLGYKGTLVAKYTLGQEVEHSSSPGQPVAERAVEIWLKARAFAEEWNAGQPRSFQSLDPSLRAMCSSDDGLQERAMVTIAYRVPVGCSLDELKAEMQSWAVGAFHETPNGVVREPPLLEFINEEPPFQAVRNTPLVRAFLQAIRDEGGNPRFALKHGTSDMNIVGPAWGCQIVAYGPGDSRLDHTPQEHISLIEYRRAIQVLARVLKSLYGDWPCTGPGI